MKNNLKPQRNSKLDREDAWMTIAETIVVFIATWLNPQAGISIFSLKLCFQLLKMLRHHYRK